MLPVNRTSFKSVLHTSVGAAWYFHVIIVIIGHLILAGLAIYHYKIFNKVNSLSKTAFCNPLSIQQCPAKISCLGTAIIGVLAILRALYYSIGPYTVSLKNPHIIFLATVQVLEYVCCSLHLTVLTLLLFSNFLILVRAKSINILTTPSSLNKKHYRFHKYIKLIFVSSFIAVIIFVGGLATLLFKGIKPILHLSVGVWFAILSLSSFYLTWISRSYNPDPDFNSFIFYSTSSSSSNPHTSPEKEAIESIIYYECHSGLPRCMTKTSLNEFFTPKAYGNALLSNNNNNNKQTSIHINDLEIVVEIQEPVLPVANIVEYEAKVKLNEAKRESLSTISSMKIATIDGEQGGYVADSEDNVKTDARESAAVSVELNAPNESEKRLEKFPKSDSLLVKKGNCDDRINIRQMILADEYMRLFLSGLNFLHTSVVIGLLLGSINIYNGYGKYGAIKYDHNRTIIGWSIWLSILSLFRLLQYVLLLLILFLFRMILSKIGETIKKTEYVLNKQIQNRRGFRMQRRVKRPKSNDNMKQVAPQNEIQVYKCHNNTENNSEK